MGSNYCYCIIIPYVHYINIIQYYDKGRNTLSNAVKASKIDLPSERVGGTFDFFNAMLHSAVE